MAQDVSQYIYICIYTCARTNLAWEEIKLYQFLKAENVVDFVFLHCNCRETISL